MSSQHNVSYQWSQNALVTEKSLLEKLYLDTYIERLKPNKIEPDLKNLEEYRGKRLEAKSLEEDSKVQTRLRVL